MPWLSFFGTASSVALAVWAVPNIVQACSPDPCYDADGFQSVTLADLGPIPTDGVIALRFDRGFGSFTDAEAWAMANVQLTQNGGGAIPGTVEVFPTHRLALFRPAAPLPADAAFTLTFDVDNLALEPEFLEFQCGEAALHYEAPVLTVSPAAVIPAPSAEVESSVRLVESTALEDLVCCDGAYPYSEFDCVGDGVFWPEGHCAAQRGTGLLDATVTLPTPPPAPAQSQVAYQVDLDGQIYSISYGSFSKQLTQNGPFCVTVQAVDLRNGDVISGEEICVGDDVVDELGTQPIDPTPALAVCADEPYTCAVVNDGWDAGDCEPWGGPGETTGGSGSGSGGTGSGSGGTNTGGTAGTDGTSAGSDSDSSGGTAGADDVAGRGCACASTQGGAMWAGLLVLPWVRRRRRRRGR